MNFTEVVKLAVMALRSNKLRSALTLLGIMIGVGAVVFVVSFGRGQEQNMTAMFESMGTNTIFVSGSSRQIMGVRPMATITTGDYEALLNTDYTSCIATIVPSNSAQLPVVYGNQTRMININGSTVEIKDIRRYDLIQGNFFTEQEYRRNANVVVLGNQAAVDLFGQANAVGESIRIAGRNFEIIGVLDKKGGFGGSQADNFVLMPLSTMSARFASYSGPRGRPLTYILFEAKDTSSIQAAKTLITDTLRKTHHLREGEDADFTVTDMQEIMKRSKESQAVFGLFLGSVAAISLLVGGIGIMNIMLVSVTERTREIGICKAIGARRRDIMWQFLSEAAMLSLFGGITGVLIALGLGFLASGQSMGFYTVNVPISPDIIIVALGVSVVTGLVSGTYPALRAARLDPIEALREK
jgi:putative ABC transport system permease protein